MILCRVVGCRKEACFGSTFCLMHFEEHKKEQRENDWE